MRFGFVLLERTSHASPATERMVYEKGRTSRELNQARPTGLASTAFLSLLKVGTLSLRHVRHFAGTKMTY